MVAKTGHNWLTDKDRARAKRVHKLATLMDSRFKLPGVNLRIGLDSIIGLIPGAGDTVTAFISAYIVLEAARLGVRPKTLVKMVANLGIDWLIGSIPLIGDLFDVIFKANERNVRLLEEDLGIALAEL